MFFFSGINALICNKVNLYNEYWQTYPESVCECLFASTRSAPSGNASYRWMHLHVLLCWSCSAEVKVALGPAASLYNPPGQTLVQWSGWVRGKPVAWSMGMPCSLYSTNVQVGVWAATGGGESPTGLFKQRVDNLANSFTKMTQGLPVFPWLRVVEGEFLHALSGKTLF